MRISGVIFIAYHFIITVDSQFYWPYAYRSQSNQRLCERKCSEFASKFVKTTNIGSLSLAPPPKTIASENCIISTGLIVGGEDAKAEEFPHMAAIGYQTLDNEIKFACGGSLISYRHVLTAAHCRVAERLRPSLVRVGYVNLKIRPTHGQGKDISIQEFISHEQYEPFSKKNDIAIIRLVSDVTFGKFVRPACLSTSTTINVDTQVVASGWGVLEALDEKISDKLQKVTLKIFGLNTCKASLENDDLDGTQICAGDLRDQKDTCQGDSGGPIQVVSKKSKCLYDIVGITSFGSGYCGLNIPGVYTRVSSYLNWIEDKVWK